MSRRLLIALGTVVVLAILAIGLSQAGSESDTPEQTSISIDEQRAALRGAPPKLAALHEQANRLLPGAPQAVTARVRELRGTPIVINKWASWCHPCRLEFPVFQRVAVKHGKRVAFLGLDGNDNRDDAAAFLKQRPLSYPSYEDPDEKAARALEAGKFYPTTVFIDVDGKRTVHQGPYDTDADLERDIRRYALDQGA
jgi:cytochrome c biogenesis protein CcmG/thiol:disulfide interchange protein DsbE